VSVWSVSVTMTGATGIDVAAALDVFADQLAAYHGAGGFNARRLDATVSVEATTAAGAARRGVAVVAGAARRAGLVRWRVAAVEAVDAAELERRNASPQVPELLGMSELMAAIGVSRQRLSALRREGRLPEPMAVLAATPVWDRPSIDSWLRRWERRSGRSPRRPPRLCGPTWCTAAAPGAGMSRRPPRVSSRGCRCAPDGRRKRQSTGGTAGDSPARPPSTTRPVRSVQAALSEGPGPDPTKEC